MREMKRLLKKAFDAEEAETGIAINEVLESNGFNLCETGGHCTAYYKDLPDDKTLYIVDSTDGSAAPTDADKPISAVITLNYVDDLPGGEQYEYIADFNDLDDFINNYNDMSNYQKHTY